MGRFYWTVQISYTANGRTKWHPTEATGPFAVLTRGVFMTRHAACTWASRELGPGSWQAIEVEA